MLYIIKVFSYFYDLFRCVHNAYCVFKDQKIMLKTKNVFTAVEKISFIVVEKLLIYTSYS